MEIQHDVFDEERIPWHPAFVEALQMELQDYQDVPHCQPPKGGFAFIYNCDFYWCYTMQH